MKPMSYDVLPPSADMVDQVLSKAHKKFITNKRVSFLYRMKYQKWTDLSLDVHILDLDELDRTWRTCFCCKVSIFLKLYPIINICKVIITNYWHLHVLIFVNRQCHTPEYCLSGASDRIIKLWNITTGSWLKTYDKGHNHEVFDIAVCNDNKAFASVGGDKFVVVWDVFTGNIIRKFTGHDKQVNCVRY